jgi:alginate O-acetyltransferase complex protein AlgI
MLFFDYSFIFVFLPITLLVYFLLPGRARNGWLFLTSCVFYSASSLCFLPILLFSTIADYWLGRRIHGCESSARRRAWLAASVALNLGLLGFFKYSGLVTRTLRDALGWTFVPLIETPLPVGISFYTFQSMSYTIDLYRRQVAPARSFVDFGAFITMFPQLVAGPIVRYEEIEGPQRERSHSIDRFADGVRFFILGLAKKILLADTAAVLAAPLFALASPGFAGAWASVILYSLQIYFDFSGYSDMAVGLGKMIGFEFPRNFDSPYKAASFAEFWKRWHITLSTWLRDNLYVPLGGNRKGPFRTYVNLFVTMLLGGIWHGAAWNYVVWGAYHGGLLAMERFAGQRNPLLRLPRPLRIACTFLAVSVGWVFFRCEDLEHSARWLRSLFLLDGTGAAVPWRALGVAAALISIAWSFKSSWETAPRYGLARNACLVAVFFLSIVVAYGKGSSPFLYFQF